MCFTTMGINFELFKIEIIFYFLKQWELIFKFSVNRKFTESFLFSRKNAKSFTVNRRSHYPIEKLTNSLGVYSK